MEDECTGGSMEIELDGAKLGGTSRYMSPPSPEKPPHAGSVSLMLV